MQSLSAFIYSSVIMTRAIDVSNWTKIGVGSYLRSWVPQPHYGVDAAGGQEAVAGVWL